MGTAVSTVAKASALLKALCQQAGVEVAEAENLGWEVVHQRLRGGWIPIRHCADARRAGLAITNGWRLLGFDRACERMAALQRLPLP